MNNADQATLIELADAYGALLPEDDQKTARRNDLVLFVDLLLKTQRAELNFQHEISSVPLSSPPTPGISGYRNRFEALVHQITGCRVGDGTLGVTPDRSTYTDPHIQWLWKCYNYKGGR